MTDIIDRLKEPEAHYPGNFDTPKRANAMLSCLCQEAMEEIESLRRELAEARQEIADRKADCETGHDQDEATIAELRQQLAASQASEQQLLKKVENYKILCQDENHYSHYLDALEALAIPQDNTALSALIAKAGEVMRERCAYEAVRIDSTSCAMACNEIRALPAVTLDYLK